MPLREKYSEAVNAGVPRPQVQVNFNGLRKRQLIGGSCTYLQNCDWRTVNTLEQEALVPRIRPVPSRRAIPRLGAAAPFIQRLPPALTSLSERWREMAYS